MDILNRILEIMQAVGLALAIIVALVLLLALVLYIRDELWLRRVNRRIRRQGNELSDSKRTEPPDTTEGRPE